MDCFLLMARMEFDDLPLRVFATETAMEHWLQSSKDTFDLEIDEVADSHGLARSELLRIEAWEYRGGKLVGIKNVKEFETDQEQ